MLFNETPPVREQRSLYGPASFSRTGTCPMGGQNADIFGGNYEVCPLTSWFYWRALQDSNL
jgi:hypothetical protein